MHTPTLVVIWLYWVPLSDITLTVALMPFRLLFVPRSAISSQCPDPLVRFIHISAFALSAVVTMSIRPCHLGLRRRNHGDGRRGSLQTCLTVKAFHFPLLPGLRKTVL
jgi:hypothetical protein